MARSIDDLGVLNFRERVTALEREYQEIVQRVLDGGSLNGEIVSRFTRPS